MYQRLFNSLLKYSAVTAPATGIGLFRLLYGLVTLQEIAFLLYFNHLIFDPIPYIDVEFPMLPYFLVAWAVCALCLTIGYRTQQAALWCYAFWIIFVQFTPMQRDFDGGFDLFMTGTCFFMLFMPIDEAFSIDNLRRKLAYPYSQNQQFPKSRVSILAYYLPISICLGFLYFDSAIHKLFAEHWRNGLGSWLPGTQPYYISALDMSPLLNIELLQKAVGYLILIFQFSFIFLVQKRALRPFYWLVGMGLHLGIVLTLNIYPFGFGMLIYYVLLVPFSWWQRLASFCRPAIPNLTIFYDEQCPLCNRTATIIKHFDLFNTLDFKGAQTYAHAYPAMQQFTQAELLKDLYTLDAKQHVNFGVKAYSEILIAMRYMFWVGLLMTLPGIYQLACYQYRKIADNRVRVVCDIHCALPASNVPASFYTRLSAWQQNQPRKFAHKLSKLLILIFVLQLNSTLHYGLFYRLKIDTRSHPVAALLTEMSNTTILFSQMFLGITPHALYVHDHFAGYDRILAITYIDQLGQEQWLPFVNQEGRLLAPNWGRVHSMWANIAVTPTINIQRLSKLLMKVTAFWGRNCNLDLKHATFQVKLKKISAPSTWVYDLRNSNLQGEWQTIGSINWQNNNFQIAIPNNINDL